VDQDPVLAPAKHGPRVTGHRGKPHQPEHGHTLLHGLDRQSR
jgi:hypothetical protein